MKGDKMKLRNMKKRTTETLIEKQRLYLRLSDYFECLIWIARRELIKLQLVKIGCIEFECEVANGYGYQYSNIDVIDVMRNNIVEESQRYRNPQIYCNQYSRIPPLLVYK